MKVTYVVETKPNAVRTIDDLAEEFGVTKTTIQTRKKEFQAEKERYGEFSVIQDGGIVLINYLAFLDFLHYRERLKEKNLRKTVPPYNPAIVAKKLGWYGEV